MSVLDLFDNLFSIRRDTARRVRQTIWTEHILLIKYQILGEFWQNSVYPDWSTDTARRVPTKNRKVIELI